MLTKTQMCAIEMLFAATDDEISSSLGVRRETLNAWKERPDFSQMLNKRLSENLTSAKRILSQICVDSCRELESLIRSDDSKDKPRAIIEVLKASGLFKEMHASESDELQGLLERMADDDENP